MECMFETLQIFNPWISIHFVRDSVFFYFQRVVFLVLNYPEKGRALIELIFGPEESANV